MTLDGLLCCQWSNALDDDGNIDDSQDFYPLYRGDPGPDPDKLHSCLAALGWYLGDRVGPKPAAPIQIDYIGRANAILAAGQYNSHEAQKVYEDARTNMGLDPFWTAVTSSSTASPKPDELDISLQWQSQNNRKSLQRSMQAWETQTADTSVWKQMLAMYYLMLGQRHNRDACNLYRAWFKSDPTTLFARVKNFRDTP